MSNTVTVDNKPDDNTFESLRFLAETHRGLHEKRQQYEWRIIFTVLSFYVLSVAAIFNKDNSLPSSEFFDLAVWVIFLVLATFSAGFLWCIHRANARNKTFAEAVEDAVRKMINSGKIPSLEFPEKNYRMPIWALAWQSTTIFLVAVASAAIITSAHCGKEPESGDTHTESRSLSRQSPLPPPATGGNTGTKTHAAKN